MRLWRAGFSVHNGIHLIIPAQAHKTVHNFMHASAFKLATLLVQGHISDLHRDCDFFETSHTEGFVKSGHIYIIIDKI